jgi:hypothetical protein
MFVLSFDTIYLFEILILIETLKNNETNVIVCD